MPPIEERGLDDRERWNSRYRTQIAVPDPPLALRRMAHLLPSEGLAVDLAGGSGAGAIFLASLGLSPVLVEVSEVALQLAEERMAAAGGATTGGTKTGKILQTVQLDLSRCTLAEALGAAIDVGSNGPPVAVVSCFHYLQRTLLQSVATDLPAGAIFACSIATAINLERNERPSRRFLLEPGELKRLVVGQSADGTADLEILHEHEGWNERDQHEAELLVCKAA